MTGETMHTDVVPIGAALVERLVADQFSHWAGLPVDPVVSSGTVNAIFRLGNDLSARLPRSPRWQEDLDKLFRWLPRLAPELPLAIPIPLARGEPGQGYPWDWSVYRWLEGETATGDRVADLDRAAATLAGFVAALHRVDAAGAPPPGPQDRGGSLATRDRATRAALAQLHGVIDTGAATEAWESALAASGWPGPPVWIHGDLWQENLLVDADGRISGVLDFGGLAAGDPACDLIVAWSLLTAGSRDRFRAALGVDAATWERGRGWALSMALIALPYYLDTNPVFVANSHRMIEHLLG